MISTGFSVVVSIKSLTKVLQPGCSLKSAINPKIKLKTSLPTVTIQPFKPCVEGNFILKDGSYLITKDNEIFNVKE